MKNMKAGTTGSVEDFAVYTVENYPWLRFAALFSVSTIVLAGIFDNLVTKKMVVDLSESAKKNG
jgi:hypothetical protein